MHRLVRRVRPQVGPRPPAFAFVEVRRLHMRRVAYSFLGTQGGLQLQPCCQRPAAPLRSQPPQRSCKTRSHDVCGLTCSPQFEDERDAQDAVRGRDGIEFQGQRLRVSAAGVTRRSAGSRELERAHETSAKHKTGCWLQQGSCKCI
jgi:hypothetical protein